MASSITRLLRSSRACNVPLASLRLFVRSGSSSSEPPELPPIKPVSGPDWEDRGWKDDGTGLGDYPNLPPISAQNKDPYKVYWDQPDRRNFGEPLHEDDDALSRWMYDNTEYAKYTTRRALFQLAVAFGLVGLVIAGGDMYDRYRGPLMAPKEYPYNNLYLELGGDPNKDPSTQEPKVIPHPVQGY